MGEADTLALDHIDAHRCRVEQQVNHVIIQQVDFVNIKQAAVGRGQYPRLKVALAFLNGLLNIERPDDPIFGRADRQVDKLDAAFDHR